MTENWHTWYTGLVDSKCRRRFIKLQRQNSFLSKFEPKKLKLFVFSENWCTCASIFEIPTPFWANFSRKSQSCLFFLEIGTHGILTMSIFIPTLVFWIVNPKSIFGQIWTENVNVVCFGWNLSHSQIHPQYLEDVDSYFDVSFLRFQT